MATREQYQELMSEIVNKQMTVLGPDVALQKALQVPGLKVDKTGKVSSITGDEQEILQHLINVYIELSGAIVKNILNPVFEKYPDISVKIK
ncbi:MAG: hypothetical protein HY397_02515 [Candidatus Doudnabacteria bacterium]|nr:hypothetical protein [Candidatus Doudnabacteria bacterium]